MNVQKLTVYVYQGLPASGKDTHFKKMREQNPNRDIKRINKDMLRAMFDDSAFSHQREKEVLRARDLLLTDFLHKGYDVAITDTNLHPKHLTRISQIVAEFNSENREYIAVIDTESVDLRDVPLLTCIKRDSEREKPVGKKVIHDMYYKFIHDEVGHMEKVMSNRNPDLPSCIVCDVDGTLALRGDRSPYDYWKAGGDTLNRPIASLLSYLQKGIDTIAPISTFIFTGRKNLQSSETGDSVKAITQSWLSHHNINFDDLYIRDADDDRPDYVVKEEIYEKNLRGKYNVLFWIDDRKQVIDKIREIGITVLDIAGHEF